MESHYAETLIGIALLGLGVFVAIFAFFFAAILAVTVGTYIAGKFQDGDGGER